MPLFTSDGLDLVSSGLGLGLVILVLVLRTWSCYITVSVLICGKKIWQTGTPHGDGEGLRFPDKYWIVFYHIISWM